MTNDYPNLNVNMISKCEVCGNKELLTVLDLGLHPMCDDLVPISDDRICKEYPIHIVFCDTCFTAHQKYQIPKVELFPKSYHYRSRFTADVLKGMQDLVKSCEARFGSLKGKKVLDVGCNDGSLLSLFKEKGATTFGMEPTDAASDAIQLGHTVVQGYFTLELAKQFALVHGTMDFICFTNVFAHIEDLADVVESLKELMDEETILVIENHYLGSVLDGFQFDTFYHEHPRTYSYKSFTFIAKSLNREIDDVQFPSRYGGNIRMFLGPKKNVNEVIENNLMGVESSFYERLVNMQSVIEKWKVGKRKQIDALVAEKGRLIAKAFPGRAAILIKLLNLDIDQILFVSEKPGSMKINHFVPGTRIPIRSDMELFSQTTDNSVILNLAWHIRAEIQKYLQDNNVKGRVVDILSKEDFNS